MKVNYIIYDEKNGEIVANCQANVPDGIVALDKNSYVTTGFIDPSEFYFANQKITPRPEQNTVLDGLTLRNLPVPSEIFVNGTRYKCDEETVELDLEEGTYEVIIKSFPYKERIYEINTQK